MNDGNLTWGFYCPLSIVGEERLICGCKYRQFIQSHFCSSIIYSVLGEYPSILHPAIQIMIHLYPLETTIAKLTLQLTINRQRSGNSTTRMNSSLLAFSALWNERMDHSNLNLGRDGRQNTPGEICVGWYGDVYSGGKLRRGI